MFVVHHKQDKDERKEETHIHQFQLKENNVLCIILYINLLSRLFLIETVRTKKT